MGRGSIGRCAGALAALLLLAVPAAAAAPICGELERSLATGEAADPAQHRLYVEAVGRQEAELDKAVDRDGRNACSAGGRASACRGLAAKIERMRTNLTALRRQRDQLAGAATPAGRTALLAALERNGCRVAPAGAPPADAASSTSDTAAAEGEANAGVRILQPGGSSTLVRVMRPGDGDADAGVRYRTVCVRTCDGYFFPMSVASTRMEFDRDRKKCEAACPGTGIALYYQPSGDYSSSGMMSWRTDEPYTQSDTAYAYKTATPPGCACKGAAGAYSVLGGNPPGEQSEKGSFVDLGAAEDPAPETAEVPVTHLPPPEERKVRAVAPAFLPDRSEAEDLRVPGQPPVP